MLGKHFSFVVLRYSTPRVGVLKVNSDKILENDKILWHFFYCISRNGLGISILGSLVAWLILVSFKFTVEAIALNHLFKSAVLGWSST